MNPLWGRTTGADEDDEGLLPVYSNPTTSECPRNTEYQ